MTVQSRFGFGVCAPYLSIALLTVLLSACGSAPSMREESTAKADETASARERSQGAGPQAVEEPLPPAAVQRFDAAVVHMNAGDLAAAEQAFRALASEYPAYSGPLVNLGILAAKAGRLEEAEQTLKQATERNARNAAAFNQLGIVYRKLGRFEDADKAYQQAVQVDPNYANAYLNLGVLCDLYLQEPQRALEAYERYLELNPSADSRVNAWVTELRKRVGSSEPPAAGG
jgi:Flp pilus assembly protein TadD